MRQIDSYGLKSCSFQADIFEKSLHLTSCSSRIFIRRFMLSEFARRMDQSGMLFESIDNIQAIQEIELQYGPSAYGQSHYNADNMYWIGYLYRFWCYTELISSRQVYKIVKPDELNQLYLPYHSLDPGMAIARIKEAKGIGSNDLTQRGVEILRRIRRANQNV